MSRARRWDGRTRGARETQRLAWRDDVDYANRECWRGSFWFGVLHGDARRPVRELRRIFSENDDDFELRAALSAPKPWLSSRGQRVQPVRHTRAQRRKCWPKSDPCRRCLELRTNNHTTWLAKRVLRARSSQ